jgi:hypothetical protein
MVNCPWARENEKGTIQNTDPDVLFPRCFGELSPNSKTNDNCNFQHPNSLSKVSIIDTFSSLDHMCQG